MIGDRPTDRLTIETMEQFPKGKKRILTMVTSTSMMLILHLKDLIVNANFVNMEKSNKAENEPRRERESNNNKEMLL